MRQLESITLPQSAWELQTAESQEVPPVDARWSKSKPVGDSIWYRQTFKCPEDLPENTRVLLNFERIEGDAIVFLNGERIQELLAPGGDVDITDVVNRSATNEIIVFLTRDYRGISRGFEEDVLRYTVRAGSRNTIPREQWGLGITAPVSIEFRQENAITDVWVKTSWRKKSIEVDIDVELVKPIEDAHLEVSLLDASGDVVLRFGSRSLNLPEGPSIQTIGTSWEDPITWELDQPYLYRAQVSLVSGETILSQYPDVEFGFREVWTDGRVMLMNGHPIRLRMTDLYGASANALSFYRLIGYNAGQIQPHSKLWWNVWNDTPLLDERMLEEADRLGFALTAPAPSASSLGPRFLEDETLRDAYEAEVRRFFKKYRNHPSILVWAVGMNSYNPQSNIAPATLGKREESPLERGEIIVEACEIVNKIDPTRLAFSHADGSLGDISSANVYLNFVPLQEREEWPMAWAEEGNMPYSAVEFGDPFTANFWKGNQFLLTEYLAMYLGDEAYEQETEEGLEKLITLGLANKNGFGAWNSKTDADYPAYWEFKDLFVTNTTRAWRTWGVNAGWLPWLLKVGYGDPPSAGDNVSFLWRYKNLPEPLSEKPEWANPNFDIYRKSNQPLLAFIAGGDVFIDKTHAYFVGETIEKQIAIVWDGAEEKEITISCAIEYDGRTEQEVKKNVTVFPGDIQFIPVCFEAPNQDALIVMSISEAGEEIVQDTFAIQTFQRPEQLELHTTKIAVYDPEGKTYSWLRELGVEPVSWEMGDSLEGVEVLLLGRESLQPGDSLPYSQADIAKGLNVIIFEQQPSVWEILGFQTLETLPRYTFAGDETSSVLHGLGKEDLINWRGSPDLLPEGRLVKTYNTQRAPRWTNRHAVASVVLKIPDIVGFTPIIKTEFDLEYTPLLQWEYGKGQVFFCSLDLSGRVGTDPVATQVAVNLLESLRNKSKATRKMYFNGGKDDEILLQEVQASFTKETPVPDAQDILVIGSDSVSLPQEAIDAFARNGGTVLYLPQSADSLEQMGFSVEPRTLRRVTGESVPLLRGIGPELLRWRDALDVLAFSSKEQPEGSKVLADGLILSREKGNGREVFLQVTPDMLANRYGDEPKKREAIQLSVARLTQLFAQFLTNLGASSSDALANRVCHLGQLVTFQNIGGWHVLGPWPGGTRNPKMLLDQIWPGEEDALAGDYNPNTVYQRDDGVSLDWRTIVDPDENEFIDLGRALNTGEGSVVYAQRTLSSDTKQIVRMRVGADYWIRLWVNGKQFLNVSEGHDSPKPAAFIFDVPLKEGDNVITVKAAGGSKGFGFWIDMSPLGQNKQTMGDANGDMDEVDYYRRPFKAFDPYQFHYW